MKKILLLTFCLIMGCSSYAVDFNTIKQKAVSTVAQQAGIEVQTNLKQRQAEKEFLTPQVRLYFHYKIMQQDKEIYNEGGDSLYGRLLDLIEKNKTLYTSQTAYLEKAKELFDYIANCEEENFLTPEQFDKKKIIISDKDFDSLDENLKKIIFMLNSY